MKKVFALAIVFLMVFSNFSISIPQTKAQSVSPKEDYSSQYMLGTESRLTTDEGTEYMCRAFQDSKGIVWVTYFYNPYNPPVWGKWRIQYLTSSDGGKTWSSPKNIAIVVGAPDGISIMEDYLGRIWVAWSSSKSEGGGDNEVWYSISEDRGDTWSVPTRPYVGNAPWNGYCKPSIIEAFGKIWIFFRWYRNREDILYVASNDGGSTWSSPAFIVDGAESEDMPFAYLDSGGRLWLLFGRDYSWAGPKDIWYKTTQDGITWSDDIQLTNVPDINEECPSIVEDLDGNLYVFFDYQTPYRRDIWYVMSDDGGNSWTDPVWLTTDLGSLSPFLYPSGVLIRENIWVFWHSNREGSYDIWYYSEVAPPAAPDFEISVSPSSLNLYPIGVNMTELRITSVGGFERTVSLSVVQPLPLGVSLNLYPASVFVPKDGQASVLMAVHTNSSTPHPASYEITIQGSAAFDGTPITHSKSISVVVLGYSSDSMMSEGLVNLLRTMDYVPTGIADYGVNNGHSYSYSTKNFTGWMYFKSLDIKGKIGKILGITLQLNVVNNVTTAEGAIQYYWIQNVINIGQLGPFGYTIAAFYNVWNKTGDKDTPIGRSWFFPYGGVRLSLPFNVTSSVSTTIDEKGTNVITFSLRVTNQEGTVLGSGERSYTLPRRIRCLTSVFTVNGKPKYTFINAPQKLLAGANVEFVLCGRSGGVLGVLPEMEIEKIDGTIFLGYRSEGAGLILPVPHGFNFGLNTAEAVKNVDVQPLPPINNIFYKASAITGKINLTQLW